MKNESETPKPRPSRAVRVFKVIGIIALLLISLLVFVFVHENWSGAREWARVEAKLIDAGVELDPLELLPEVPPAETNFGAHPFLISLNQFEKGEDGEHIYDDPETVEEIRELNAPKGSGRNLYLAQWQLGKRFDFEILGELLELQGDPVEGAVAWLKTNESTIAELDRAAELPEAIYPISMGGTFIEQVSMELPYIQDFMNLARFQAVRACAELRAGNEEEARKALQTLRQLSRVSMSQPTLISYLVGVTIQNFEVSTIWYGLEQDLWSEESLVWIQHLLDGVPEELVTGMERSLNFELCAFVIGGMDYLKAVNSGEAIAMIQGMAPSDSRSSAKYAYSLIPNGIWDHNKAFAAEWLYDFGLEPLRRGEVGNEKAESELGRELRIGSLPAPRRFMAGIMVPAMSGISERSFETATSADFARVSCALELYKKREGDYPDNLSSLVPDLLSEIPEDRFSPSNEPIQYRREGDRFLLYSVGQNRTDEGGEVGLRESSYPRIDRDKGDLVWGYEDFADLPEEE